jgi:hypothetical protein
MDIGKHFAGEAQDDQIELRQKIMRFRDEVYETVNQNGNEQARKLAGTLMFAMFGMSYGYKPCCVFEFCLDYYQNRKRQKVLCPKTKAVMCTKCVEDFLLSEGWNDRTE